MPGKLVRLFACYAIACLVLVHDVGHVAQAEEAKPTWPQWRGPARDGKYAGPVWPTSLKEEALSEVWRVELGPSYSGPIVTEDRVFTTETRDRKFEVVRAFDRQTGKESWKTEWEGSMRVPFFAASNGSWIRSTPAYDGKSLFVAGMRDVLVCLNAADGKIRWRKDFVADFETPLPAFGFVCSPLLVGDHVYVQAAASFVKLDKETGKVVWRTSNDGGGMYGSAFSSPVEAVIADKRQILLQTRTHLKGIDEESGKELWSQAIKAFRGMNILTPTVYKNGVFTSATAVALNCYVSADQAKKAMASRSKRPGPIRLKVTCRPRS